MLSKKGKGVNGKIKFGDWLGEHSRESLDFLNRKIELLAKLTLAEFINERGLIWSITLKNSKNPKPTIHREPLSLIVTPC